jgi:4-amino-4-deoxy-L-arabinose transferase-like glycosyltransferase
MDRLTTFLKRLFSSYLILPALWLVLIAASISVRPLFPIDETRYASVAWEMWVRHDFLVPHLNSEAYSHKPPLLFWLMHLSWGLFGVNDWTFRLIAPLFGLGGLFLVRALSRILWPTSRHVADMAPLILFGCVIWQVYSTLTMFDIMLAFFVLLGMYALATSARSNLYMRRWLLFGIAIAGGIFSKGPVILLHLLPTALLAPLWIDAQRRSFTWLNWYSGLLFAVLLGAAIALCWAIPAGLAGGEAYRNAIFLGQTTGRLVESFAHRLPWWWYLQLLPLLLLPWLLMKPFWLGMRRLTFNDSGIRFCLAWLLPVFVAFSLVSGKRLHYLLPLMPALALLLTRAFEQSEQMTEPCCAHRPVMLSLGLMGLGGLIFGLVGNEFSPLWGMLVMALAAIGFKLIATDLKQAILYVTTGTLTTVIIMSAGFFSVRAERYDTAIVGRKIAELQAANRPIVFFGAKYHGQFHFTGRLQRPFKIIDNYQALLSFAEAYPDCALVTLYKNSALLDNVSQFHTALQGKTVGILNCSSLSAHPELAGILVP